MHRRPASWRWAVAWATPTPRSFARVFFCRGGGGGGDRRRRRSAASERRPRRRASRRTSIRWRDILGSPQRERMRTARGRRWNHSGAAAAAREPRARRLDLQVTLYQLPYLAAAAAASCWAASTAKRRRHVAWQDDDDYRSQVQMQGNRVGGSVGELKESGRGKVVDGNSCSGWTTDGGSWACTLYATSASLVERDGGAHVVSHVRYGVALRADAINQWFFQVPPWACPGSSSCHADRIWDELHGTALEIITFRLRPALKMFADGMLQTSGSTG